MGCSTSKVITVEDNQPEISTEPKIVRACLEEHLTESNKKSIMYLNSLVDQKKIEDIHKKEDLDDQSSPHSIHLTSANISKRHSKETENGPKKDKKEILKSIEKILEEEGKECDDISTIIKVLCINSYEYLKEENENLNYRTNIKFSYVKETDKSNWLRKPLKGVQKETEKFFKEKEDYRQYHNFIYNNKYINEYELFPEEDLTFTKLVPKTQKVAKSKFNINTIKNKPTLFVIFDIKNINSLHFLQNIIDYHKNNNNFALVPLYGKEILSSKEPLYIQEQLNNNEIDIGDQNIYFISDTVPNKIKQYLPFLTDDQNQNVIPLVCLIDNKRRIRCITSPEEFSFGLINLIDMNKEKFKEDIDKIKSALPEEGKYKANLSMRKCTIYTYDKDSKELKKEEKFYEGIRGSINDNVIANEIRKIQPYGNILEMNTEKRSNKEQSSDNTKKLNEIIKKEVDNFSNVVGIEMNTYDTLHKTSCNILSITNDSHLKLSNETSTSFSIEFKLDNDLFQQQFQMAITSSMGVLHDYPQYGTMTYSSCLPKLKSKFASELKAYDVVTKEECTISLNDSSKYNLVLVFSYSKDFFDIEELKYRFKKLTPYLDNENLNIVPIFRGELSEYKKLIKVLDEDNFISNNNLKVKIVNSDYISVFPFYYENGSIESSETSFIALLTDKDNNVIYEGNFSDVKMNKMLRSITSENESLFSLNLFKMNISYEDLVSSINQLESILSNELNNNDSFVKQLNYRPYVNISYTKRINNNNINIENVTVRILLKAHHISIFKESKELRGIIKKFNCDFNACVLIIPLECTELELPVDCNKCGEEIEEVDPFYYDQEDNVVYCVKCEHELDYHNSHMIYIKSKDFDNEIIDDFFTTNISTSSPLASNISEQCALCDVPLSNEIYISMTQFNINKGFIPLCICQQCFNSITNDNISNSLKSNVNKFCINCDNLIFRKITIDA